MLRYRRVGRVALKYGVPLVMTIGGVELIREGLYSPDSLGLFARVTTGALSLALSGPVNLARFLGNEHVQNAFTRVEQRVANIKNHIYESRPINELKKTVCIIFE